MFFIKSRKKYDNEFDEHYQQQITIKQQQIVRGVFFQELSQEQLAKTLFPIGELTKPEVRRIAAENGLITAEKKDSQGLCFIGKVRLPDFLQQKLKPKKGVIVEVPRNSRHYHNEQTSFDQKIHELIYHSERPVYVVDDGTVVGEHSGAHYFTVGQRKGLSVGGTKEPLVVLETDVTANVIYTGQGKDHPGLLRKTLFVKEEELHWVRTDLTLQPDEVMEVYARIRYRQPLQKAKLYRVVGGMYVDFVEKQSAITEGQFVAWYNNDELLGSGVIS